MITFPSKQYDIIYADPPWECPDDMRQIRNGSAPYPYMSLDDMCLLPVNRILRQNALLFLWIRSPMLLEGIQTGESWGFRYITVAFVWDKQMSLLGNYTLSQCEMCLVFKRGKIPQPRGKRNIRQFLSCKKSRHSDKPDEIRHRITEMFPTQSKIELFARVNDRLFPPMQGWDYWGNEA